jgi:O-antigen/teichoic acid export membrane protein
VKTGGANIAIRLLSLVAKAFSVFFIARILPPEDFGAYITILASISFYQYVVIADFSYPSHRLLILKKINLSELIGTQGIFILFTYFFSCIFLYTTFPKILGINILILTLALLFFEAVSSEFQRILTALGRVSESNIVIFIKSALWLPGLIAYSYLTKPSVTSVLNFWLIGIALSCVYGAYKILKLMSIKSLKFSANLLREVVRIIPVVLVGTLATRTLFSLDRVFVEMRDGFIVSGAYGYYVGVASAFVAILDFGILLRAYPSLVAAGAAQDWRLGVVLMREIAINVSFVAIFSLIGFSFLNHYILAVIDKSLYLDYELIGFLLIISYAIYSISFGPQCFLYGMHEDKYLCVINVISLTPIFFAYVISEDIWKIIPFLILACSVLHLSLKYYLFKRKSLVEP